MYDYLIHALFQYHMKDVGQNDDQTFIPDMHLHPNLGSE